jgi:type II secretory pathway pseudopilin PulG
MLVKLLSKQKGFTYIELILYLGLVAFVLSSLINFGWNVILTGAKSATEQEVFSTLRFASEKIKSEIRNAAGLNLAESNFEVNLAGDSSYKLSLAKEAPNDPTIIDVFDGKVRLTQGASLPVDLNSARTRVTDLTFTNYSSADGKAKNIGFVLTVVSASPETRQEYQKTATLRSAVELRSN